MARRLARRRIYKRHKKYYKHHRRGGAKLKFRRGSAEARRNMARVRSFRRR